MKKFTWLSVIACALILLTGCKETTSNVTAQASGEEETNQLVEEKETQISALQKEVEELQHSLENLELDLNYSKEEAAYYKEFLNGLIEDYTEEQKNELARGLWEYELKVNEVAVSEDGEIQIKEDIMEISIIQRQPAFPILNNDVFAKGRLSGQYHEHLSNFSEEPTETYGTDGTTVTGIHYKFENLKAGATITFTITDELKERLKLTASEIRVAKVE